MKAKPAIIAFLLLFYLTFVKSTFAALYINEFSSGTSDSDWVEIYNSDSNPIDLSLYILRDSTFTNKLDLSGSIGANGFATFEWSNKLNNSGDTIKLLLSTGESLIDQVIYGGGGIQAPEDMQTAGRTPDGSSNIVLLSSSTKGSSNNSATPVATATLTPTYSPTSTNTPTPTKSPTPTPTLKSSATPTPIKTPTPTSKPSLTLTPSTIPTKTLPDSVLGEATKRVLPTKEEEKGDVKTESLSSKSDNLIAKIFIFLGVVFLLACAIVIAYPFIARFKREKLDG